MSFTYPRWAGFVTYTGLGSWDGRAIAAHVADWVGDGANRTMSEVAGKPTCAETHHRFSPKCAS